MNKDDIRNRMNDPLHSHRHAPVVNELEPKSEAIPYFCLHLSGFFKYSVDLYQKMGEINKLDNIIENITTIAHAIIIVYVIYILDLAITSEYDMTTLHIIFLALGWMLFMCEGIMSISKNNVFTNVASHKTRVTIHWVFQCVSAVLVLSGCIIEYVHASTGNYDHFSTPHGISGLVAFVCCFPTYLNGVLALFNTKLRNIVKPTINKLLHAVCGMITFIAGGVAMIYSTQTYWFARFTTEQTQDIWYYLLIFTVAWSMVQPFITASRRLKTLVK